jgi:hypothetical protein
MITMITQRKNKQEHNLNMEPQNTQLLQLFHTWIVSSFPSKSFCDEALRSEQ